MTKWIILLLVLTTSCATQRNTIAINKLGSAQANLIFADMYSIQVMNQHGLNKDSRKIIKRNARLAKREINTAIRKVRISKILIASKEAKSITKILITHLSDKKAEIKKLKRHKASSIQILEK